MSETFLTHMGLWLGLVLMAASPAALAADRVAEPTAWFSIAAGDGAIIGHASHDVVRTPEGREITDLQAFTLLEEGGPPTRVSEQVVTRQDASGRVSTINTLSRTGGHVSRSEIRIVEGRAWVTRDTGSGRGTVALDLPPGLRFDGGEALLAAWDFAAAPRIEFEQYDFGALSVERVILDRVGDGAPDGQGRVAVVRRRYHGDELIGVSRLLLDRDRRVVAVIQPMFGTTLTTAPTDRETALAKRAPYRVLINAMTRSPFRIPDAASQGHIRYRFSYRDGLEFPFPRTGEQKPVVEAGVVTLDICAGCGPGLPTDAAYLSDALKPTAWLQSDHARLKAIADPIARLPVSDARKMEELAARARPYLTRLDFTGHYSALETVSRKAGDCTEAAVLLAALGRSAGIPTRVVNGMVYSRERYHGVSNAFLPHSWVLAYADGQWRSYDAALGAFDATHIALTVGDGDTRSVAAAGQLASLLKWDGLTEVRRRPGA